MIESTDSTAEVDSVNLGRATPTNNSRPRVTGIGKVPTAGPVQVSAPGRKGVAGSGLAGDAVCDLRHHGGDDQAVYAYAREDLDRWQQELERDLPNGLFGENLTTAGLDITNALVGERWAIGSELVLEVSVPRIPCRTFAGAVGEKSWVKKFTQRAIPGTYLRVITPGPVRAGDAIIIVSRPDHQVTVAKAFRAFTAEPELMVELVGIEGLSAEANRTISRKLSTLGI